MTGDSSSPFDAVFESSGLDPMEAAQRSMRSDLPKRFWSDVSLKRDGVSHQVLLDGRPARTPARHALATRHAPLAEVLKAEWDAVEDRLDPSALPMTRLINVAVDRAGAQRDALLDEVASYAQTDLLCYRAALPHGLAERQRTVWDPYLERLKTHHGIVMALAEGVVHVEQSPEALSALRALADTRAVDAETVTALNMATTLTGSAVLALALTEPGEDGGRAKAIWQAAHVDEDWNRQQWGEDSEASALRAQRWRDFEAAATVLSVTRQP